MLLYHRNSSLRSRKGSFYKMSLFQPIKVPDLHLVQGGGFLFLMNFPPPAPYLLHRNFFPSICLLKLCIPEVRIIGQSSHQSFLPSYTEELSRHMVPFLFVRYLHIWFHTPVLSEFWTTVIPLPWLEPMNCPKLCSLFGLLSAISTPSVSLQTLPCCSIIISLTHTDYSSSSQHKSLSLSHIFST